MKINIMFAKRKNCVDKVLQQEYDVRIKEIFEGKTENSSGVELNICTSLEKSEKEHIMEIMEKDVRKENIIDIASELAGMEPIHKARITGYIEGVNEERRRWQERTMVVRRK